MAAPPPRESKCCKRVSYGYYSDKGKGSSSDVWLPCRKLVFQAGRFLPARSTQVWLTMAVVKSLSLSQCPI